MKDAAQFGTAEAWRAALGLLPFPLRDTDESQGQYVLLNGATGNFCLDFVGGLAVDSQRATAWSCDVGHYITCTEEYVVVNGWGEGAPEERYTYRSVIAHLHDFHRRLEKNTPDRSRSITTHVLRVLRRIRAVRNDGLSSLRVLLHLLASAAVERDRLIEGDWENWGLTPEILEASRGITEATWRPLYNDLSGLGRYDIFRPDFQLFLRHASGSIFQDAHLVADDPKNLWLPGFEEPVTVDAKATPGDTGVYFTPPALARTVAEEATNDIHNLANRRLLLLFDPACGSGELLKECLRLLKLKGYSGRVRVIGWDKSPAAVDMTRFVLSWEKLTWPIGHVDIEISEHDSLITPNWPNNVDILVMNPPFRSWELMAPEEQEVTSRILGSSSKPNLAMGFAHRALDVLGECGVLAMILPNSLLEGKAGKDTREAMAAALSPQLVARLGSQSIFQRALVDSGMYVGKRKPCPSGPATIVWADSRQRSLNNALRGLRKWRGGETEPIVGEGFSVYRREDVANSGAPWIARAYNAWSLYQRFEHSDKMLPANRMFEMRQGSRLGSDVFIVPKEYVDGLRRNERRFFRPAVMNPSIIDGKLSDAYYIFYRYSDGLPPITSETELEEHVPKYFKERLRPAKPSLQGRRTLVREAGLYWWDLLWPRTWQNSYSPKIVSKYFGGARSFAFDKTGDFVVVVGNAWLLKKNDVELKLDDDESYFAAPEETYSAVLAYLNSAVAYGLLEYLSIQISGGQLDLSRKYVETLPVPDLSQLTLSEMGDLIQMGTKISEGKIDRWADVDNVVLSILSR